MDLLILLYFAYAVYRAGLDAAVNSYALSRGRDVYIGDGARRRRYSGWTLGAALAVLAMSLLEGWKAGWHWGGRTRDGINTRRRAARPRPAGDGPTVSEPDAAPWTNDPSPDEPGPARPDTDEPPTGRPCGICGQRTATDVAVIMYRDGHVEHFACRDKVDAGNGDPPMRFCDACGDLERPGDPLVWDDLGLIHTSHTHDPRSDVDPPSTPAATPAADVVDTGTGQPVDAVWEPLDTPSGWPSVPTHSRTG
ncbi:hypothetical protein [Frankia sp. Cas4]|uniref:hypothetical protein n=1 Tax=Frankia sp. Cas4 TaxID=3073927 RepID=UPI002AD2D3DD|nr:hypothetical protein [Frankia sp. Cas4]